MRLDEQANPTPETPIITPDPVSCVSLRKIPLTLLDLQVNKY